MTRFVQAYENLLLLSFFLGACSSYGHLYLPNGPCQKVNCSNAGTCKLDGNDQPYCECEPGYQANGLHCQQALTYTIGGQVTGLTGSGLVLQNNGQDDLPLAASGAFRFLTPIAAGGVYQVTVKTHPSSPSQSCLVGNGSGTVGDAPVTDIVVTCGDNISAISTVWANNGEDKVLQNELRAHDLPDSLTNSVWDGNTVSLFGARNEVIAFNLILEAAQARAEAVTVHFERLSGPNQSLIQSSPTSGVGVFDWTDRPIELFYIRYLQIKGLSLLSYNPTYDERHIPERLRRPWQGQGVAEDGTLWNDRPGAEKYFPDIAIPLEIEGEFAIEQGKNQSIWIDIYIPKSTTPGDYLGTVLIKEHDVTTHQIPIDLRVRTFTLPDLPAAKTMLYMQMEDPNQRYLGNPWPNPGTPEAEASQRINTRHFMVAHRHKISLIQPDKNQQSTSQQPSDYMVPFLTGAYFQQANGYAGPGENTPNDIYPIGIYGGWKWFEESDSDEVKKSKMQTLADGWVTWFQNNAPETEIFLYLMDEPEAQWFPTLEKWAGWLNDNPGPGKTLMSFCTIKPVTAASQIPALDYPSTWSPLGVTATWENVVEQYQSAPGKTWGLYNGMRPMTGSMAIEDDGVSPRVLPWTLYKKKAQRYFIWESTYYHNFQCASGLQTNVFNSAHTFGCNDRTDAVFGQTGWNYCNGDGVLFYPGTDTLYPEESYGLEGPFVSLRMKHWRRGIQDVDYLTLAAEKDPTAVAQIVEQMIPKVLWEYGVENPNDPTYIRTDISWSNDPDVWEAARKQLADIIEQQ